MGPLEPREIAHHSILWKSKDAGPWLVTFDFAAIGGRVECVGVTVRSYLRDVAEGPEGQYQAYWDGEPVDQRWFAEHVAEGRQHPLFKHDLDALEVEASAEVGMVPRPLRAATMRELPFGDVLERVRQNVARAYLGESDGFIMPPDSVLEAGDAALEAWADEASTAYLKRARRGVRNARYTDDDLRRVASIYRRAFEAGSSTPTKDVAAAMGIPHSSAAKLIMRCRTPEVGLLGPTERSHAGGILPPDTPTERGEM